MATTLRLTGLVIGGLLLAATSAFAVCGTTSWQLTAGQHMDVGSVTVSNDATNVYIRYLLDEAAYPDATLGNLHVWVGNDLANLPANSQGIPVPGQFCSADGGACFDATGLKEYTFTIPFADIGIVDTNALCGTNLYVFTHAEVDTNGGGEGGGETAWGGDTPGTGSRWFFYGIYTVCCDPEEPVVCLNETAFAKGGYVWTTDKRSNPEKLPTLSLTKNRWGWAINLTGMGLTTYDIYAGAGLNKTSNGIKVGTLTVDWNGTTADVTYTMLAGYLLEEVHIYAGDNPPTTTAPGQFGLPVEGYDAGDATAKTYTGIPLIDTNGDGVWIVAHAVVTTSCE